MKQQRRNIIKWEAISLICLCLFWLQPAWAVNICNISIDVPEFFAWSENTGWSNWHASHSCVAVAPTYLVGYVWAESIGWIKLGVDGGGPYGNTDKTDGGVNWNSDTGVLWGYAWSENTGWINFNPTNGGVTINMDNGKKFEGWAWGESVGWIHFQNDSPAEYYVQQAAPFAARGFEDYVRLEWETASEIDTKWFHLWRGDRVDSYFTRITDVPILAEGGTAWGAAYVFEDIDVFPGKTYFYELEEIDTAGVRTFHGPVSGWAGVVNIQAGGGDELLRASKEEPISVTVAVRAGEKSGNVAEYWVAAYTPFGWFTYGPEGWNPRMEPAAVMPLVDIGTMEVLDLPLPTGWYTFYLAVDDRVDGIPDPTWLDSVEVEVD